MINQSKLLPILMVSGVFFNTTAAARQEKINELLALNLNDLLNTELAIGSRGTGRSMRHSPVPLDVITAEDIAQTGYAELGKILQLLLPAFNFPRPSLADGTDHARPFTLRGMGADQVLVLINGKRRHQSALLHVNSTIGRGTSSVDINMIPAMAIKRIEVLRDGAAAQYGSDAIAGIINIVLKTSKKESLSVIAGQTREGDGRLKQMSVNGGMKAPHRGFVNWTAEIRDRASTNRAGADPRDQYFTGDPRNTDTPVINHQYGDAALRDWLFMLNAELPDGNGHDYYTTASLGYREGEAAGFFRRPADNRTVRAIYPDGFLPLITPEILDVSASFGVKSTWQDWTTDGSYHFGLSDYNLQVSNSLNASLGTDSPRQFDSGSLQFYQHIAKLDLFKKLDFGFKDLVETGMGQKYAGKIFLLPLANLTHIGMVELPF